MSHYAGHKKVAANTFQTCEKHLQLYPIRFPMSICLTLSLFHSLDSKRLSINQDLAIIFNCLSCERAESNSYLWYYKQYLLEVLKQLKSLW